MPTRRHSIAAHGSGSLPGSLSPSLVNNDMLTTMFRKKEEPRMTQIRRIRHGISPSVKSASSAVQFFSKRLAPAPQSSISLISQSGLGST